MARKRWTEMKKLDKSNTKKEALVLSAYQQFKNAEEALKAAKIEVLEIKKRHQENTNLKAESTTIKRTGVEIKNIEIKQDPYKDKQPVLEREKNLETKSKIIDLPQKKNPPKSTPQKIIIDLTKKNTSKKRKRENAESQQPQPKKRRKKNACLSTRCTSSIAREHAYTKTCVHCNGWIHVSCISTPIYRRRKFYYCNTCQCSRWTRNLSTGGFFDYSTKAIIKNGGLFC